MARIVIHTERKPLVHRTKSGDAVAICMCGMSRKYPFCDGTHRKLPEEDGIHAYTSELESLGKVDAFIISGERVEAGKLPVKKV